MLRKSIPPYPAKKLNEDRSGTGPRVSKIGTEMVKKLHPPTRIPVPGNKIIEEYTGYVSTGTENLSIAQMAAPAYWTEPFQTPEFDEVTIVLSGTIRVEHNGEHLDVGAGEMVLVSAGERIRYSNPFSEPANYYAICSPAFNPKTVHREE